MCTKILFEMQKTSLLIFSGIGIMGASALNAGITAKQPNVIYVFPDQMRNSAMEFWNEKPFAERIDVAPDPVKTPNLNEFAKQSVVLTSAYSNCPLSSPHRGSLFTGYFPNKSGVTLNCNSTRPNSTLRADVATISDVYSQNGYDCAYIGKYHMDFPTPNNPQNPGTYVENKSPVWDAYTPPERRHGFNFWYSYGTFDVHKKPHYWDTQGKRHEIREWSPKHEADVAVSYLKNEHNQRDFSKPFLMVVSMNPPHHPYSSLEDCMEEDYNLYKDKSLSQLFVRANADTTRAKSKEIPYYFAQITGVDREFGRILKALEELGLDENTIVVFSSDHGETMCSHSTDDPKNSVYTESTNVPFLIRYPKVLKPSVKDLMISTPDIMPTLLSLSNLKQEIPSDIHGRDLSEFFKRNKRIGKPKSALYIRNMDGKKDANGMVLDYFPTARGLKMGNYTLELNINRKKELVKVQLFDDKKDPYQLQNLSPENYNRVYKKLLKELAKQLKRAEDSWYEEKILSDLVPYN